MPTAYKTDRRRDTAMADCIGRFMDNHFYSLLGEKWQRVVDPILQRRGVDVIFGGTNIDEKVKVKNGFLNKILEYPSFELSFVNRTLRRQNGWFVDRNNITDYYAFIAVFTDATDEYSISDGNIDHLNVLFVKKTTLMRHVLDSGIDLADDIKRLSCDMGEEKIYHSGTGIHTKISTQFSEKPINMVVRRDILLGLGDTREFEVYDDNWNIVNHTGTCNE